jgi:hypothetical protein
MVRKGPFPEDNPLYAAAAEKAAKARREAAADRQKRFDRAVSELAHERRLAEKAAERQRISKQIDMETKLRIARDRERREASAGSANFRAWERQLRQARIESQRTEASFKRRLDATEAAWRAYYGFPRSKKDK